MRTGDETWSPWRASMATTVSASTTTALVLGMSQPGTAAEGRLGVPSTIDAAVALAVAALGSVAGAVLTVGCALMTLSALLRVGGHASQRLDAAAARLTPGALRRAVAVTVTAGLAVGATTTVAGAAEADLGWTVTSPGALTVAPVADPTGQGEHTGEVTHEAGRAAVSSSDPGGSPAAPPPEASPPAAAEAPPATSYTVVAGDSLWRIAAAHLPATAEVADIATAWPRWYEANRSTVADPDVIHPGQVLLAPDTAPSNEETS